MKRSTNLAHFGQNDRRKVGQYLVETFRMLGLTDDEIKAALEKYLADQAARDSSAAVSGSVSDVEPAGGS